jgi:hypothetical protein
MTDLTEKLSAAADLLGVCLGARSVSRRHGFRPDARLHVERFFTRTVLGVPVKTLCERDRLGKSAVYSSVLIGGRLVRKNARLLGVTPDLFGFARRDDQAEAG